MRGNSYSDQCYFYLFLYSLYIQACSSQNVYSDQAFLLPSRIRDLVGSQLFVARVVHMILLMPRCAPVRIGSYGTSQRFVSNKALIELHFVGYHSLNCDVTVSQENRSHQLPKVR